MEDTYIKVVEFLSGKSTTAFVNILSIVSFALTIWVAYSVRNIRRFYVFTARVPEITQKIKKHNSKVSELLNDFENSIPKIQIELTSIQVLLSSLKNKTNKNTKQSTNKIVKTIRSYNFKTADRDQLWDIYLQVTQLVLEIEDLQKDLRWEQRQ